MNLVDLATFNRSRNVTSKNKSGVGIIVDEIKDHTHYEWRVVLFPNFFSLFSPKLTYFNLRNERYDVINVQSYSLRPNL